MLDRKPTSLGRDTGWQLKADSTIENEVAYGYHPTDGRLSQVSNPQISNLSFSYGYVPNSNLLETVTGPIHTVTNIWEPNRDVLDIKQNKVGTDVVSKYDYLVNGIGQRTEVSTSGTAFPALPSWLWGYDSLGQVISADSSVNTSDRAYEYDAIGNRKKSATSLMLPATDNYATNALNQYTLTAASAVTPMHDFDGNLISGPLPVAPTTNSTLVWDAKNRLSSTTVGNVTTTTLFDAKSRRIAKTTGGNTTIYLYDGWNCIAEYRLQNSSFSLHTSRIWGSDLSNTLQGAGGVGGLLCESQISNSQVSTYSPTYDGNGNVSEYLASNGSIAAHFEYDPFGNTVINTDSGNLFNHRFSTKPIDRETGLYYYGYRYYDSLTGRWPSRDPIGERGGINIFAFITNDSLSFVDFLGLESCNKSITIDISHGGSKDSRKTKRGNDRIKNPDPNHKFCSVGCGSNAYNSQYDEAGIGIDDYPVNNRENNDFDPDLGDTPSNFLDKNGFGRNDLTGSPEISQKIDEAIEAAKEEAKAMCKQPPDCCKTIDIKVECQGAESDDGDIRRADSAGRNNGDPKGDSKCGTTIPYQCNE